MGVGSLSRNLGTNYEVGGAGTSDSSVGSGNASKAGTDEEKWKNEIDWLYNLLEQYAPPGKKLPDVLPAAQHLRRSA